MFCCLEKRVKLFISKCSKIRKQIGRGLGETSNQVDNAKLIEVNEAIRNHPVEYIGEELRGYMTDMKRIAVGG